MSYLGFFTSDISGTIYKVFNPTRASRDLTFDTVVSVTSLNIIYIAAITEPIAIPITPFLTNLLSCDYRIT